MQTYPDCCVFVAVSPLLSLGGFAIEINETKLQHQSHNKNSSVYDAYTADDSTYEVCQVAVNYEKHAQEQEIPLTNILTL